MSNEKQETVSDIVAAMRNEGHAGDASCLEWVGAKIRGYADRIEAAHQREVAELRKCLGAALEVVDSTAEKLGVINSVKSCEEYKMWHKVLESTKEAKDEGK